MRALVLLLLSGCWLVHGSQVYPVRDHVKVRAIGGHTGWLADRQHWITAAYGQLAIVDEAIEQGPPMPIGFVDKPLHITVETTGGEHVWIPWVDEHGQVQVTRSHMRNGGTIAATLPERAFGAPVLLSCADAFSCDGGVDAVVGVVVGWTPQLHTRIVRLPELAEFVVANNLAVYWNKQDIPGESMHDALEPDE